MNGMRVGSLFTGYGGLDMAVGGDLAWYAEIEKAACQVLAVHHPDVPNLGDITAINWADVEPVDILTGGYPCQPFSHAGNRKGKNDERHLWPYVLDAIRAIRPRFAILENVSGHITLGFADVLADLAEIGWFAEWGTYRASDVGAPHRRERLFIIACNPDNNGRPASERGRSLREGQVTRGQQQHEAEQRELARGSDSLVADANSEGLQGHDGRGKETPTRGNGLNQQRAGSLATDTNMSSSQTLTRRQGARDAGRLQPVERGGSVAADTDNGHGKAIGGVSGLWGRHASRGDMPEMSAVDWGKYAPAIQRWATVLDRPAPAPTVERKDKRRLNPQFVEWMMGLPDGWVTGHGLSAAQELKMLGNGVVPQQAHAAITQLMQRVNT